MTHHYNDFNQPPPPCKNTCRGHPFFQAPDPEVNHIPTAGFPQRCPLFRCVGFWAGFLLLKNWDIFFNPIANHDLTIHWWFSNDRFHSVPTCSLSSSCDFAADRRWFQERWFCCAVVNLLSPYYRRSRTAYQVFTSITSLRPPWTRIDHQLLIGSTNSACPLMLPVSTPFPFPSRRKAH